MRFASYEHHHRRRVAVVEEDVTLLPLPGTTSLTELLARGDGLSGLLAAGTAADGVVPGPHLSEVRLLPPFQPASVRDFVTFEEHVEGVRRSVDEVSGVPEQWYAAPTFCFTNPHAIHGPGDGIPVPPGSTAFDFELEVGAVIGREGRDLTPEQARDHIAGYTVFNDWCGCLAELWGLRGERTPPALKPGDTVSLTVEGIGTLTNTVVPGADPVPLPSRSSLHLSPTGTRRAFRPWH
ncbi:fumarylacetoacetate hydrolase family protein [Streptomyces sp. F-1]|uniref:fumarylacetoacetate hydrolase family protein n=1 Tax=Streptomyces sp. F-1 TaxID=463642 RepID=UPI00085C62A8|nr:fumarylacetoacetate hydrolase family protein [Streptomyces sp. F-1]SFY51111.1 Ureidoglycolate lyase [Streptomyces sp. F-1]